MYMSREIKFRSFRTDTKEMLSEPYDGEYMTETTPLNGVIKGLQKHENQILMQYTGLKDKNGTEIYEGDIVKLAVEFDDDAVYPVEYSYNGYWLEGYEGNEFGFPEEADIEVVGNIYENPELLKEGVNNG